MPKTAISSVVILAAGQGRRLWPFAEVRQKAAIPICNTPNVRRLVDDLVAIGIQRIVVIVGYQAASVRAALFSASREITFVEQPAGGGTADAVLAGMRALGDDQSLIVFGDVCTTRNTLQQIKAAGEAGDADGIVLVDKVPAQEGSNWYHAHVDDGKLKGVTAHDAWAETRLSGVFVLPKTMIPLLEANPGRMTSVPVGGMPPPEPDLAQTLHDWPGEIRAVQAEDFVNDMDKPWHIIEANTRMAEHLCGQLTENHLAEGASIHPGAEIEGFVQLGEGAEIGNRVVIKGNLIAGAGTKIVNGAILGGTNVIGARTEIKDYCYVNPRTIIGRDCIVGHGAEMDGVLFDRAYLWHYCEMSGLIGESVDIGAATVCGTLRFDDGPAEHNILGRREKPLVESCATYIGDHSRTGVNVITNPGAKIGCYTCIGGGVVVTGDVPSRTLRLLKQETMDRPWGPERYGW
jgi:bifunctional UDP-N-acetylglucosamine pyrophosphorylase/glucosamine-1-phosphate N-acetyltransferase